MAIATIAEMEAQIPPVDYGASIVDGKASYGHHYDEPFAMHSVMKFPQALYVAHYLREHRLTMVDSVLVSKDSLDATTWSPMLDTFSGERYFTYAELLRWSLAQSDNNACDILFASCGMPAEVEKYIHSLGFKGIHISLTEKEMKQNPQRAIENSSTPREMAELLEWFYRHRNDNQNLTFVWRTMAECSTGLERIAAIVPKDARLIHKTGSGFPYSDGLQDRNDVGIIVFSDGSHIAISVFAPRTKAESDVATIAEECIIQATKAKEKTNKTITNKINQQ